MGRGTCLVAVAALLAASVVPSAADDDLPAAGAYDWSGFYAGVQGGLAVGQVGYRYNLNGDDFDVSGTANPAGGILGGTLARYGQLDRIVYGVRTELNYSWAARTKDIYYRGNPDPDQYRLELDWYGLTQARLGYASGRTLLTVGAGVAYGGVSYTTNDSVGGGLWKVSETKTGWTAGASVEHAVSDSLVAELSYNYLDFGAETRNVYYNDPQNYSAYAARYHVVMAGLKRKF